MLERRGAGDADRRQGEARLSLRGRLRRWRHAAGRQAGRDARVRDRAAGDRAHLALMALARPCHVLGRRHRGGGWFHAGMIGVLAQTEAAQRRAAIATMLRAATGGEAPAGHVLIGPDGTLAPIASSGTSDAARANAAAAFESLRRMWR